MDQHLKTIDDSKTAIKSAIVSLGQIAETAEADAQTAIDRKNTALAEASEAEKRLKEAQDTFSHEKSQQDAQIATKQKEIKRLNTEMSDLVDKKSDLMIDNARLERENRDFKSYEKEALATLEAKDAELVARERNITEKENLTPLGRSFLPPKT